MKRWERSALILLAAAALIAAAAGMMTSFHELPPYLRERPHGITEPTIIERSVP